MDILKIKDENVQFRELDIYNERRKKQLIKRVGSEYRLWNYPHRVISVEKYVDLGVMNFFRDRLEFIETLFELKFFSITLLELANKVNTTTFFLCIFYFREFVIENELNEYIHYELRERIEEFEKYILNNELYTNKEDNIESFDINNDVTVFMSQVLSDINWSNKGIF